ncbi:hypothetical protein PIB30_072250 [Stylosanthes scabra]|uniref:Uncharacterized protein n=1 Tax=Stylosanthes scabra TaxID=79078 RepID=A0ABU6XRJ1_9FABA|nr:hypothetical protein [Stylosanthes scabra]
MGKGCKSCVECVCIPPTLQRCVRTISITSRVSALPKWCIRTFLWCIRTTPKFLDRELVTGWCMDHKRNQAALKGKEEVRAPPTRMSARLVALRALRSPPIKMRTPSSRASPRLAALKNSPLPLSPTSVLRPKKLLVLMLVVPKPMLPPVTPVQKDPETPVPEIPRVPKMRRTARKQFGSNSLKGFLLKEDHP